MDGQESPGGVAGSLFCGAVARDATTVFWVPLFSFHCAKWIGKLPSLSQKGKRKCERNGMGIVA